MRYEYVHLNILKRNILLINHEISERTNATAKLGIWKVDSSLGVLAKNIHFFRVFLENAMSEIKRDGKFF